MKRNNCHSEPLAVAVCPIQVGCGGDFFFSLFWALAFQNDADGAPAGRAWQVAVQDGERISLRPGWRGTWLHRSRVQRGAVQRLGKAIPVQGRQEKSVHGSPAAEAQGYERASKYPKSTKYGRQNPISERWNSYEQLILWRKAWADISNVKLPIHSLHRFQQDFTVCRFCILHPKGILGLVENTKPKKWRSSMCSTAPTTPSLSRSPTF